MKKFFYFTTTIVTLLICSSALLNAQGVAINASGAPADPSAIIDITSSTQGTLISRMTMAERDAIPSPATGLTIYNTDCNTFNYNAGTPSAPVWSTIQSTSVIAATVSISASPEGAICVGTGITFTATALNEGSSPIYQWKVNNINVGTNSPVFSTDNLNNGDEVKCQLTSNEPCVTQPVVTSDAIIQVVNYSAPTIPGVISGNETVMRNSTGNPYSISAIASATSYTWTVPDGATITAGQGTPSITVTFGSESLVGTISVVANNECGSSIAQTKTVVVGIKEYNATGTGRTGTIQSFTVGASGVYTIEAFGAQGADFFTSTFGGKGARMKGDFFLTSGTVLDILVGQTGEAEYCGGGGGSFVVANGVPLIIAGGGGGASSAGDGLPGVITTSGTDGFGGAQGTGGSNGGGGGGASGYGGGGGGGFCGDGGNASSDYCSGGSGGDGCTNGIDGNCSVCTDTKGLSFLNGGLGGSAQCYPSQGDGGFGGGGAAVHGNWCAGGGGGYSGGGGGGYGGEHGYGGGGGSYNSGTSQSNSEGVQTGNGKVIITW